MASVHHYFGLSNGCQCLSIAIANLSLLQLFPTITLSCALSFAIECGQSVDQFFRIYIFCLPYFLQTGHMLKMINNFLLVLNILCHFLDFSFVNFMNPWYFSLYFLLHLYSAPFLFSGHLQSFTLFFQKYLLFILFNKPLPCFTFPLASEVHVVFG